MILDDSEGRINYHGSFDHGLNLERFNSSHAKFPGCESVDLKALMFHL